MRSPSLIFSVFIPASFFLGHKVIDTLWEATERTCFLRVYIHIVFISGRANSFYFGVLPYVAFTFLSFRLYRVPPKVAGKF